MGTQQRNGDPASGREDSSSKKSETRQPSIRGQFLRYLPSQVLPAITAVVFLPIITRIFPPEDFGIYSLVLNAVALTDALTAQWLAMALIRYLPQERWSRAEIGATVLGTNIAVALFAGLLGVLVTSLVPAWRSYILMAWAAASLLCTRGLLNILASGAQVQHRSTLFSIMTNIQHAGGYTLAIILASRLGVVSLILGPSIVELVQVPLVTWIVFRGIRIPPWTRAKEILSTFYRYGFPLGVGGIGAWGTRMSDRYVVGGLRGLNEAGLYSAAYDVASRVVTMGAAVLWVTARPQLVNTWEKVGPESTRELFTKFTRYYILYALPVVIGAGILARPIFRILVAPEYRQASPVLIWVYLGTAFVTLQYLLQYPLQLLERTRIIPVIQIVGGVVNVILNVILVPYFGYMAAGVNTLITYAGMCLVVAVIARRSFSWPFPVFSTVRATVAALLMILTIPPATQSTSNPFAQVGIGFAVGMLTYATGLLVLGEFRFKRPLDRGQP